MTEERTALKLRRLEGGEYEVYWLVRPEGAKKWRMRRRRTGTDDVVRAEAKMFAVSRELEAKQEDRPMLTVMDAVAAYIAEHLEPRGVSPNSLTQPAMIFGSYACDAITPEDVAAYTRDRIAGKYGQQAVKPATVRKELTMLQAALNWAFKHKLRATDRYQFEKPPEGRRRDRWIDEAQEGEIRAKAADARIDVRIFIILALTYAVRRGAMLELRWDQVDFRSETIDFNTGARVSRKRRPIVPMTPEVHAIMQARHRERQVGRVLDGEGTLNAYERFMRGIGYEWVTPHVLKHSAISLMMRAGVSVDVVSRLTATSVPTLIKHYRHHSADELLEAATRRRPVFDATNL